MFLRHIVRKNSYIMLTSEQDDRDIKEYWIFIELRTWFGMTKQKQASKAISTRTKIYSI